MARYAHISGWGMSVPERVMTNDDWVLSNDELPPTRKRP
jgi:3-oxoacyl-[acyl-carrier-protein] synthase III